MIKYLTPVWMVVLLLGIVNCESKTEVIKGIEKPEWVENLGVIQTGIGAIGFAKADPAGSEAQMKMAEYAARTELAKKIEAEFLYVIAQSREETQKENPESPEKNVQYFDKRAIQAKAEQFVEESTTTKAAWVYETTGEMWVWCVIDGKKIEQEITGSIASVLDLSKESHKEVLKYIKNSLQEKYGIN